MGDGAGKDSIITEYKPLEQGKALVVRKTVLGKSPVLQMARQKQTWEINEGCDTVRAGRGCHTLSITDAQGLQPECSTFPQLLRPPLHKLRSFALLNSPDVAHRTAQSSSQ
ncbi:hypothetical protein NQZ68_023126 [Dissostichus eleginoides]|nr:hypothetical protein NQZ68_023126 [Dissostichus eleginoides]